MYVRKPTRIHLKLEDDIKEYEDTKQKVFSSKSTLNKRINKGSFATPGSLRLEGSSRFEEQSSEFAIEDTNMTSDNIRSNPIISVNSEQGFYRSPDYISGLLRNVLNSAEDEDETIEEPIE